MSDGTMPWESELDFLTNNKSPYPPKD